MVMEDSEAEGKGGGASNGNGHTPLTTEDQPIIISQSILKNTETKIEITEALTDCSFEGNLGVARNMINVPTDTPIRAASESRLDEDMSEETAMATTDVIENSETTPLNKEGSATPPEVPPNLLHARRHVRLRSKPQDEFLLPPLARQETEEGIDELPMGEGAPPVSPRSIAAGMASAFNIVRKVSQRVSKNKQGRTKKTKNHVGRVYTHLRQAFLY